MDSISFAHYWLHLLNPYGERFEFLVLPRFVKLGSAFMAHLCTAHFSLKRRSTDNIFWTLVTLNCGHIFTTLRWYIYHVFWTLVTLNCGYIFTILRWYIYHIFWTLVTLNYSHIFTVAWPALINTPHTTVFKESAPESASESESESASYRQMYLLKFSNVLVEIAFSSPDYTDWQWFVKCICPNCRMYLLKLSNVFVKIDISPPENMDWRRWWKLQLSVGVDCQ